MALSKPMRDLLKAVAQGGCYEAREFCRRYPIVPAQGERELSFPAISTVQALLKRGFLILDSEAPGATRLRVPYAITEAGRAELAKEER